MSWIGGTRWLALAALMVGVACNGTSTDLLEGVDSASRVVLDGGSRRALVSHLPHEHSTRVKLPRGPIFEFSIAVQAPENIGRGRVRFTVHVRQGHESTRVFDEIVRARRGNMWRDRRVNLGAWSRKEVDVVLSARPEFPAAAERWSPRVRAAWGAPTIVDRDPDIDSEPSVILVLVDTLRRDFVGAYGFEGDISPNLDWLARESVIFENAFTQAPWTKPSVATLFTSLHADVHGVDNHGGLFGRRPNDVLTAGVLVPEAVTLAESFRENGYRTAAFVANPWLDPRFGFAQGFDVYELDRSDEKLIEEALAWMDARPSEPFFLYLHLMGVHGPYDAPEEDYELLRSSSSLDAQGVPPDVTLPPYLQGISWFAPEELRDEGGRKLWSELVAFRKARSRTLRARYAANVRRLDRNLGPFLEHIRNSRLNEEVVLMLTSDHGEELLEHGGWDHGFNLYDHQLRVPMMVRLRGGLQHGKVARAIDLLDVAPTLSAVAGLESSSNYQGRELSRVLFGERRARRFVTFATATKHRQGVYSVRTARYKLVYDEATDSASLFDLKSDPGEYHDVASAKPKVTRALLDYLEGYLLVNQRASSWSTQSVPLDERQRTTLESLGYLGNAPTETP